MIESNERSPEFVRFFEQLMGRSTAIIADRCRDVPFGCGGDAVIFRDDISRREYQISGMCQKCQDAVFSAVMDYHLGGDKPSQDDNRLYK